MRHPLFLTTVYWLLTTLHTSAFAALDAQGWTILAPSSDSRQIYLDPKDGNDANTGLDSSHPLKTAGIAKALLRDGYPDCLRVKCGTTVNGRLSSDWRLSGRSAAEPMVVTSYGTGPRPVFQTGSDCGFASTFGIHCLAFVGLDFYAHTRDPDNPAYTGVDGSSGLSIQKGKNEVHDILIEDCVFRFFRGNISLDVGPSNSTGIALRRNMIMNSYPADEAAAADGMGTYVSGTVGLLLEENFWYHCGFNEKATDANKGIQRHNVYVQTTCRNTTSRRNISILASNHGMGIRGGGTILDNFIYKCSHAILCGFGGGTVESNVILAGKGIGTGSLGWGIDCVSPPSATADFTLTHNLIANQAPPRGNGFAIRANKQFGTTRVTATDNVIYNWDIPIAGAGYPSAAALIVSTGNKIQTDTADIHHYPAPARTLAGYSARVGGAGTEADFLAHCMAQRKGAWDPNYTATKVNNWFREGFGIPPINGPATAP